MYEAVFIKVNVSRCSLVDECPGSAGALSTSGIGYAVQLLPEVLAGLGRASHCVDGRDVKHLRAGSPLARVMRNPPHSDEVNEGRNP